ncbi:hypothetical protein [Leptospira yasudae]|uniref:hypothetical protein n=1 Tax=Leptospira yasudae TaxID=2202201 RepID=UPI00109153DC|nr:hypothetical protein [Leptospira yasudae]TGN00592.1 hypothetical protein EHR10_02775 [Leptospira yasudae]
MKAKIIVLLIALFAVSAFATGCSSLVTSDNYHNSAGSYYVIQEAKIDYVDSKKSEVVVLKGGKFAAEKGVRVYLDLLLFVPNLFYYYSTDKTIFGTISQEDEAEAVFESEMESLTEVGRITSPDDEAYLEPDPDLASQDPLFKVKVYGDIVLAIPNILFYSFTGQTIFGTTNYFGQRRLSTKAETARIVLSKATVEKRTPIVEVDYLNPSNLLDTYVWLWGAVWGIGKAGPEEVEMQTKAQKPYFTSDQIMNRFDAETFGQLLTDANLVLDDLDLSAEDVEELKQNGYLDFVEDDAKSIPTFEAAPVKGKKK